MADEKAHVSGRELPPDAAEHLATGQELVQADAQEVVQSWEAAQESPVQGENLQGSGIIFDETRHFGENIAETLGLRREHGVGQDGSQFKVVVPRPPPLFEERILGELTINSYYDLASGLRWQNLEARKNRIRKIIGMLFSMAQHLPPAPDLIEKLRPEVPDAKRALLIAEDLENRYQAKHLALCEKIPEDLKVTEVEAFRRRYHLSPIEGMFVERILQEPPEWRRAVKLIAKNSAHPKLSPALKERILQGKAEVTTVMDENGENQEFSFYDSEKIGEGGMAEVSEVAYFDAEGRLQFTGCKRGRMQKTTLENENGEYTVERRQRLMSNEVKAARKFMELNRGGKKMQHTMRYRAVAVDGKYIFLDLYKYQAPDGTTYQGELLALTENPKIPNEALHRVLLGGAKSLIELEQKHQIQPDFKLGNVVIAQGSDGPTGMQIDLGATMSREEFLQVTIGINSTLRAKEAPEGMLYTEGYYFPSLHRRMKKGILPAEKQHTFSFGVALKALLTGKGSVINLDMNTGKYTFIEQDWNQARPLPSPPYAEDTNEKLLKLAEECMSQDSYIPMTEVVERYEAILNDKNS